MAFRNFQIATKNMPMLRNTVLALLFLLLLSFPKGQNHLPDEPYKSLYHQANELYTSEKADEKTDSVAKGIYLKIISLLEKQSDHDSVLFDCYVKSGILSLNDNDASIPLQLFLRAIDVQKRSPLISDSLLFQPYLFAGTSYYNMNALDAALNCYRSAEKLVARYPGIKEPERLYNKWGALFYETGDYKKSIQYFNKALSLVENHANPDPYFVVNYKNNIASAYRKLQEFDTALLIYKSLFSYHLRLDELNHNIAVTYLGAEQYPEAIHWLEKVSYGNAAKYNDLALAWIKLQQPDSATYWLDRAERQHSSSGTISDDFDYANTLLLMGDWQMMKKAPVQALQYYQAALIRIDPDFRDTAVSKNPSSFQGLHNLSVLFDALGGKSRAFLALDTPVSSPKAREDEFNTLKATLALVDHVEKTYGTDEAKLFLSKRVQPVYQQSIAAAMRLYQITGKKDWLVAAFQNVEDSKAAVLRERLQELSLATVNDLPQDLIQEEKNLRSTISKLNLELDRTTDTVLSRLQRSHMLDLEIRLSELQEKLDENPKYHDAKFSTTTINPEEIQRKIIGRDEALVSYYKLGANLICFHITREKFGSDVVPIDSGLFERIVQLRKLLSAPEGSDPKSITNLSTDLFTQLVKPCLHAISDKKRLIIIPHNETSYIPFECLRDPGDQTSLLQKFFISYEYSANFLTAEKKFPERSYEVLGMAPFAEPNPQQNLPALPSSRSEIEHVKGKILIDSAATKPAFLQAVSHYPVIHLATHAFANDQDPMQSFIEFYNDSASADTLHRLYESEIYHLDLKSARLVILSACETGNGQLVHGEGIMSLSRAFAYAGCRSAIASLWKADDEATAFITGRFHDYCQKGYSTDEALQLAKLDYLDNGQVQPQKKTPAYWAHLVLIGDHEILYKKSPLPLWILSVLLVLAVLWLRQKTGRKNVRSNTDI